VCWNDRSTTPSPVDTATTFRITHPFHPLFGREFELLERRATFGRDRVYYEDSKGRLHCIPRDWTDLVPCDPFVEVSAGRSLWRVDDLLKLVEQLGKLLERDGRDA